MKTYVEGTHLKHLGEALLMCTSNIYFNGEARKIIPEISLNTPPYQIYIYLPWNLDRQTWADNLDSDQTAQGLHSLPSCHNIFATSVGSQMNFWKY